MHDETIRRIAESALYPQILIEELHYVDSELWKTESQILQRYSLFPIIRMNQVYKEQILLNYKCA